MPKKRQNRFHAVNYFIEFIHEIMFGHFSYQICEIFEWIYIELKDIDLKWHCCHCLFVLRNALMAPETRILRKHTWSSNHLFIGSVIKLIAEKKKTKRLYVPLIYDSSCLLFLVCQFEYICRTDIFSCKTCKTFELIYSLSKQV